MRDGWIWPDEESVSLPIGSAWDEGEEEDWEDEDLDEDWDDEDLDEDWDEDEEEEEWEEWEEEFEDEDDQAFGRRRSGRPEWN